MSTGTTALARPVADETTSDVPRLFVVFRVGGVEYALAANEVLQMESFTGATSVPGSPAYVTGIIQLRGRVVPVIDLRARFGLEKAEPTLESRVIVGEESGRAVALLADTAREVLRIARSEEKPPPRLVEGGGFVKSVVQTADRTILVLDFAKVIGQELIDV